jgi:thiosulfate reductase cytochrome b subunit
VRPHAIHHTRGYSVGLYSSSIYRRPACAYLMEPEVIACGEMFGPSCGPRVGFWTVAPWLLVAWLLVYLAYRIMR